MLTLLRRATLFAGAAALVLPATRKVAAQTAPVQPAAVVADPTYPFVLPPLPYATSANEPSIDAQTMELHHDKHHAAYTANLNAAVKDNPQVAAMSLTQMLGKLNELPDTIRTAVRNNGGGHAWHSMFLTVMGGKGGDPDGDFAAAVTRDFGSFAQLKTDFNKAGLGQFGSGWAVVLVDSGGKLSLGARPNQDSPLMDGKRVLFRQRRLGTCPLSEIPEPPRRLSGRMVERGELAGRRRAIQGCESRDARHLETANIHRAPFPPAAPRPT